MKAADGAAGADRVLLEARAVQIVFAAHAAVQVALGASLVAAPVEAGASLALSMRGWGASMLSYSFPFLACIVSTQAVATLRVLALAACSYHTLVSAMFASTVLHHADGGAALPLAMTAAFYSSAVGAVAYVVCLANITVGFGRRGPAVARGIASVSPLHELLSLWLTRALKLRVVRSIDGAPSAPADSAREPPTVSPPRPPAPPAHTAEPARPADAPSPRDAPRHVAVIMDGQRRFARQNGLSYLESYERGGRVFLDSIDWCRRAGVRHYTVFAFSTENWRRSAEEVGTLMGYFERTLRELLRRSERDTSKGARLRFIGRRDRLQPHLRELMARLEQRTATQSRMLVNIAIDYSGSWDLVQASQLAALATLRIATAGGGDGPALAAPERGPPLTLQDAEAALLGGAPAAAEAAGGGQQQLATEQQPALLLRDGAPDARLHTLRAALQDADAHERLLSSLLCTAPSPPVDLLIRTGGDHRVSNFLLQQAAYAELLFLDRKWPEMREHDFAAALAGFAHRARRFGQ